MPLDSIDIKSILAILTFLAGAGSATLGMLKWFSTSERKKFAAEREFHHLQRNHEQMQRSLEMMAREIDEMQADLHTTTACFQILLAQSNQSVSGLFAHKPKKAEE